MIPIAKPWIGEEEKKAVLNVLDSGMLASGKWVKEFEQKFARYIGVKYAIATTNGTQALILILEALGIRGKDVLVPSFTFISSATSVIRAGGKPVFVDVDPKTFNIDINDAKKKITKDTVAIMPVHLYGQPADMGAVREFAEDNGLHIVEDACQAHGAEWDGKKVGGLGTAAAFSFYPTKNMTTGEGGMVTTNNDELAERVKMLRNHGQKERYLHTELGWNYIMTNIAAAIGLAQLKKLDKANKIRKRNAKVYDEELNGVVETPYVSPKANHVYHQYTIKVKDRNKLIEKFNKEGIGFGIYYPKGIHQQPIMKKLGFGGTRLKITEDLTSKVISIPVHPLVHDEDIKLIAEVIKSDINAPDINSRS